MTVTVDRLEWWCDICEYGMAVESELAAGLMAKMHADEAHPEPHSHGRADV